MTSFCSFENWIPERDNALRFATGSLKALPNWNPKIFKQISWIDIEEEIIEEELTLEQVCQQLGKTIKIIK